MLSIQLVLWGALLSSGGPWDVAALDAPPPVTWLTDAGDVRLLMYQGEPYRGKPTSVFAYYAAPKKHTGKLPAMVLVHGGGGTAFREWAALWAKRGYAAIAMDLAGRGPDKKRLPDGGPDQSHTQKFYDIKDGLCTAWPYHAVANVIRAHSLIRSFKEIDPARIGITGISWGGYLTCIVAGIDARFRVAVPVYGCGFLHENSCWLGDFAKLTPKDRALWIKNYDPSQHLSGCAMPALFVNGTNDFAYPLDSYRKSYRLVRGPRTLCVTVAMPHGHHQGWAPKEIGLFVDAVLRGGKPLARITTCKRSGTIVSVTYETPVPIKKASLHYSEDTGAWQKRKWRSVPAVLGPDGVRAELPAAAGLAYFLTLEDARGAIVSTEHDDLHHP